MNETVTIDRQILEDTIVDLESSKALLEGEQSRIATRINALGDRIKILQGKLQSSARSTNGKTRLRKGEGVEAILGVLNPADGLGLSQAQISEKTGITGSSVYRLLTKNKDKFVMFADNLWRKKI